MRSWPQGILIFSICLLQPEQANSGGRVSIRLVSFANPGRTTFDGTCCERGCTPCDTYFIIRVNQLNNGVKLLKEVWSEVYSRDSITFGKTLCLYDDFCSNYPIPDNPVIAPFHSWTDSTQLYIGVFDSNYVPDKSHHHLSKLITQWTQNISFTDQDTVLTTLRIKLKLSLSVTCDKGYFYPACTEFCSNSTTALGHYYCDFNNAKKVCYDGWYGANCTQPRKACVPTNDESGHFTCNNVTGDKVCLKGWTEAEKNCTVPVLSTTKITYSANTSHSSFSFVRRNRTRYWDDVSSLLIDSSKAKGNEKSSVQHTSFTLDLEFQSHYAISLEHLTSRSKVGYTNFTTMPSLNTTVRQNISRSLSVPSFTKVDVNPSQLTKSYEQGLPTSYHQNVSQTLSHHQVTATNLMFQTLNFITLVSSFTQQMKPVVTAETPSLSTAFSEEHSFFPGTILASPTRSISTRTWSSDNYISSSPDRSIEMQTSSSGAVFATPLLFETKTSSPRHPLSAINSNLTNSSLTLVTKVIGFFHNTSNVKKTTIRVTNTESSATSYQRESSAWDHGISCNIPHDRPDIANREESTAQKRKTSYLSKLVYLGILLPLTLLLVIIFAGLWKVYVLARPRKSSNTSALAKDDDDFRMRSLGLKNSGYNFGIELDSYSTPKMRARAITDWQDGQTFGINEDCEQGFMFRNPAYVPRSTTTEEEMPTVVRNPTHLQFHNLKAVGNPSKVRRQRQHVAGGIWSLTVVEDGT